MNPNDIIDYALEGAKWLGLGGGGYLLTFFALGEIPALFSEKIKSQKDLDRIAREEAEKLGMTKQFKTKFSHDELDARSILYNDGSYEIRVGGLFSNRSTVRHELYHIHRDHFDWEKKQKSKMLKELAYFFIQEPQAILYETFRIKL